MTKIFGSFRFFVVALIAVVLKVVAGKGLATQVAAFDEMVDALDAQLIASGVRPLTKRFPLEKTSVVPTRLAAKTLAAATVGTRASHRPPTPSAATRDRSRRNPKVAGLWWSRGFAGTGAERYRSLVVAVDGGRGVQRTRTPRSFDRGVLVRQVNP